VLFLQLLHPSLRLDHGWVLFHVPAAKYLQLCFGSAKLSPELVGASALALLFQFLLQARVFLFELLDACCGKMPLKLTTSIATMSPRLVRTPIVFIA
jgi:hypothetical protein